VKRWCSRRNRRSTIFYWRRPTQDR